MDIYRCRFVNFIPYTITSTAFSHRSSPISFPSNDLRLAVGRSNGDIEIWNPKGNWSHEITLSGSRERSIEGLCWAVGKDSPPRLFSIGGSTFVTEWDLATGKPLINYDCNSGVIWSIDVNQDDSKLAVGCDDGTVVAIDISGGPGSLEHDFICQRQNLRVLSIKWYANDIIVGGCADARVRCWSATGERKGNAMGNMRVDKSKMESTLVWYVLALPQRQQIVSGDSTGCIKIWDAKHFTLLQSYKVHEADVLCLESNFYENKIFSAGVDRKIHEFDLLANKNKNSKWVHSCNRLLHANDVRSMSIFESKSSDLIVSGGAEASIVIQKIKNFYDGPYKKLSVSEQQQNVIVNSSSNLIILWQDQEIRIWRLFNAEDFSSKKLMTKLKLSSDDNIKAVAINDDATLLCVAGLSFVKIFRLLWGSRNDSEKLNVVKVRDTDFDAMNIGGKKLIFFSTTLLVLTPEDEIFLFQNDDENKKINFEKKLEIPEPVSDSKSKLAYVNSIKNIILSQDHRYVFISRFDGSIEAISLDGKTSKSTRLTRLTSPPHLMTVTNRNTLLVLTEENKLYEFFIDNEEKLALLTPWSKRNSEFLPKAFLSLEDRALGIYTQRKSERVWIYGSSWLAFFDLSLDIPINKEYHNGSSAGAKKRNKDGLVISENDYNDEEQDLDGYLDIVEDNIDKVELSLKQSQMDRVKRQLESVEPRHNSGGNAKPFWLTKKYRPILKSDTFNDGIVVVEKPVFASPSTPSFNLPKLKV